MILDVTARQIAEQMYMSLAEEIDKLQIIRDSIENSLDNEEYYDECITIKRDLERFDCQLDDMRLYIANLSEK